MASYHFQCDHFIPMDAICQLTAYEGGEVDKKTYPSHYCVLPTLFQYIPSASAHALPSCMGNNNKKLFLPEISRQCLFVHLRSICLPLLVMRNCTSKSNTLFSTAFWFTSIIWSVLILILICKVRRESNLGLLLYNALPILWTCNSTWTGMNSMSKNHYSSCLYFCHRKGSLTVGWCCLPSKWKIWNDKRHVHGHLE